MKLVKNNIEKAPPKGTQFNRSNELIQLID